jgi:hypothetical protein
MSQSTSNLVLSTKVRWLSGMLGLVLLLGSVLILYRPPASPNPALEITDVSLSLGAEHRPDLGNYLLAAMIAGFVLVLYGLNGRVITYVDRNGLRSEPPPGAEAAARNEDKRGADISNRDEHHPQISDDTQDASSKEHGGETKQSEPAPIPPTTDSPTPVKGRPEPAANLSVGQPAGATGPAAPPQQVIPGPLADYGVYEIAALPEDVIKDLLNNWPSEAGAKPTSYDFEWALRKRGPGNLPWIIKFRGRRTVRVSYGGQGKRAPTVEPT